MPITQRALKENPQNCSWFWHQVNDQFQQVRDARDHARVSEERLTLTEWQVLYAEYRRVRALLYGLLPEIEER